ncbi:MAG: hypothetical protein KJN77_07025 [Gammaproteobacteria bacterium]|nr:hypothetical protein [Gammaproteobacteria bacterium]
MTKAPSRQTRIHSIASCTQKTLLPLFAVGGSLAAAPVNALELGDAIVQSRLGQPLRASIAFALAPNERLADTCVSLSQGQSPSGLPGIGRATISIADGALLLQGVTPVREPLVAANIVVKCPSTANLSREYMMFIDPKVIGADAPVAAQTNSAVNTADVATSVAAASEPAVVAPARQTQRTAQRKPGVRSASNRTPVSEATRYQVQPGDSLSEITQRIENRSMALWPAVNRIFEANPDAFIDNDPNKLKAGSWLTIPSFDGRQPVVATARREATDLATAATASADTAPADIAIPRDLVLPQQMPEPAANETVDVVADFTPDLPPAEDAVAADPAVVSTAPSEIIAIPDKELQGPQTNSKSPNVPTAAISGSAPDSPSSTWMLWLAGFGVAVILALLFFGRSLRNRFVPNPLNDNTELPVPERTARRKPESDGIEVIERVDWNLQDDSPTLENPVLDLDADLVMGTGLGDATENSQISEIGFPAPTEVDIELPLEPESLADEDETDIVASEPSGKFEITVESEVLPEEEDYDLSVIVDATEMPQPGDEDQSEVQSIEVEAIDENLLLNDNTVDPSIAFDILEQDYEDELSATQAVNLDVARAALGLTAFTEGISEDSAELALDDDETAAMSVASVTDLAAAEKNDVAANDDATSEFSLDDATVEMPSVDDDKTEIMSRKRRKLDSKAG